MKPNQIIQGDTLTILRQMPSEFVDTIITSPPYYGLRDYGVDGQIGLEKTLNEYLTKMLEITAELKRVLKPTGTMFWNHGDCYGGTGTGQKPNHKGKFTSGQFASMTTDKIFEMKNDSTLLDKCLALQNFRLVIKMIDEQQWILRNVIIWHKPNCMPSSIKDRFTVDYEPVFFFSKSKKYWFETQYESHLSTLEQYNKAATNVKKYKSDGYKKATGDIIRGFKNEQNPFGRNKRCVWKISTQPFKEAHFATFPEKLIEPMILAGCPKEICKKCGKARKKIFEKELTPRYELPKEHPQYRPAKKQGQKHKGIGDGAPQPQDLPRGICYTTGIKDLGLTDCHCNAGWDKGIVLDPFFGSGTTGLVAKKLNRNYIGIEINPDYCEIARKRLGQEILL